MIIRDIIDTYYSIAEYEIKKITSHLSLVKDSTARQTFLFKIHTPLCKPNFNELASIYKLVTESGLSPKILEAKTGAVLERSGDLIFSMQKFLRSKPINSTYEKLLAQRLAELHRRFKSYDIRSIKNHFTKVVTDIQKAAIYYGYDFLIPVVNDVEDLITKLPRQLIHGDPHLGNVICHRDEVFFIDFDSATFFHTIFDVSFAAFRCMKANPKKMYRFVDVYNSSNPPIQVEKVNIWKYLVYMILQRILFILIEKDNGQPKWMTDLENQQRFLDTVYRQLSIK